jgi:hypothetical protein
MINYVFGIFVKFINKKIYIKNCIVNTTNVKGFLLNIEFIF